MKKAVFFKAAIFFAVVFMVVGSVSQKTFAAEEELCAGEITDVEGNACGTLRYVLYRNGTMVITGKGQGASYRPFGLNYDEKCPWHAFRREIKNVIFDCAMEGTAQYAIGKGASINGWFADCENLIRVTGLPDGITDMAATFLNCGSLTYVEKIPATVKTLQFTFKNCKKMVIAPNLPASLEDDLLTEFMDSDPQVSQGLFCTFQGCVSLKHAPSIPENSALYRMTETFRDCTGLMGVGEIPSNITCFQATFYGCENLKDVLYVRAPVIYMTGGVFQGVAKKNSYVLFVKTDTQAAMQTVMNALEEDARVFPWDGEFTVNFMVFNTRNNLLYGVWQRKLNLRFGTDYANQVLEDYRSYFVATHGNYYAKEHENYGGLPVPAAMGFVFEGWYLDAEYTRPIGLEQLVNPGTSQLKMQEITLYAKMRHKEENQVLTINPNGGLYDGKKTIITVAAFEPKSFARYFSHVGDVQPFVLPVSGEYVLQAYGAQGGRYEGLFGGFGGEVVGTARLDKGTVLYVNVGGGGQSSNHLYAAGGYNGGGSSVREIVKTYYDDDLEEWVTEVDCCAGGGGASDIRVHSPALASRILVAGGGGGAGLHNEWYCRSERPDFPNIYEDDDEEEYEVYDRTIESANGQGGASCAGGGGGMRGGAHNYTGEGLYGKLNSSYGGTNWHEPSVVNCTASNYFAWGEDSLSDYGKDGMVVISHTGAGHAISVPTREGYLFDGWSVEGDGEIVEDTVFMGNGSTVLTAKWTPVNYEIHFDARGGSVPFTFRPYWNGYLFGHFGRFPVADKEGARFLGWYTEPDGGQRITEEKIADTTGNITLYAHYEMQKVTVYFYSDGGSECRPLMVEWGKPYGILPVPSREGHVFLGWRRGMEPVDGNTRMTLFEDHVLQAQWKCIMPPDISMNGECDGWRNIPFPVDIDIRDKGNEGLKTILVRVVDANGNRKTVISEFYERGVKFSRRLSFTIGNPQTKEYEGVTEWIVAVTDYNNNRTEYHFSVKLDFTPPVIGCFEDDTVEEKEYVDSRFIRQNARDNLSGIAEFYLLPGSAQNLTESGENAKCRGNEEHELVYDTDQAVLKNEAAYVLHAVDRAGNRTEKIMFTKISVNNTIVRTVPPGNYR